jgi:RNA polymerase sigma-70 factor (ECF subfamily)
MTNPAFTQNHVPAFNERRELVFERFYNTYRTEVKLRVNEILGISQDVEDLVNDIFIKMYQVKGQFETLKSLINYLRIITETKCRDLKRRKNTPVIKMDALQEYYQRIEDRTIYLAEIKVTAEAVHYIASESLAPQCKEIYILSFIRYMRNKEIAELLGISEKTVENQINIALNKLRKQCKKDGGRMYFIELLFPILWGQLTSL